MSSFNCLATSLRDTRSPAFFTLKVRSAPPDLARTPRNSAPTRTPTLRGTSSTTRLFVSVATKSSSGGLPSSSRCASLSARLTAFLLPRSPSSTVAQGTTPVMYSSILAHGAFLTFSKMQIRGWCLNISSTAAKNVWPEVPLSSKSCRLRDRSMEKSLQLVPATRQSNAGTGRMAPQQVRAPFSFMARSTMSANTGASKLRFRYACLKGSISQLNTWRNGRGGSPPACRASLTSSSASTGESVPEQTVATRSASGKSCTIASDSSAATGSAISCAIRSTPCS
mmetsp:Transcript_6315/g.11223  ORF Transcript_6315/g.11223 Transcript_6315/m.11223 type:complete len:282 (+) Transcript_6315:775-1620(+)